MNAYNRFIQVNRQAYGPDGSIEFPELMVMSVGNLMQVQAFAAHREGDQVTFQWATGQGARKASPGDLLNIVLLLNKSSFEVIETGIRRDAGQATIPFAMNDAAIPEGYVFWSAVNDKDFSPSVYWRGR